MMSGQREQRIGTALVVAVGLAVSGPAMAEQLTVVGWGGALSAAEENAFEKPFTADTGIAVTQDLYNGGLGKVRAQIETGRVTWDVLDAEMADAQLGCDENLLEEIPTTSLAPAADGTSAKDDFLPDALHDCGVANYVWATVYAYNEKKYPNGGPSTIADLFDVKKFPGKRGMRKNPKVNLEWALMADGVAIDKVYEVLATPEGVDRAFKVLDRIKSHVVWWEAGAQPPQMLADEEVAMTSAYNGRLYNAIVKEKQAFKIVWHGQVWDYGAFIVPKGAPNRETALAYVKYATSPQQLANLTNYISYGPARRSAMKLVSAEIRPHLPTDAENFKHGVRANGPFWSDHGDALQERFNAWLAK